MSAHAIVFNICAAFVWLCFQRLSQYVFIV